MASSSSRLRIGQFYASKKKRKLQSPSLKPSKIETDSNLSINASPSTKGSLDSFLVTSQDDKSPAKHLETDRYSATRHGLIKRNLNLSLENDSKETYSCIKNHSQSCKAREEVHLIESEVGTNAVEVVSRQYVKDSSNSGEIVENSELKQFTSDFMSLYFRELQPYIDAPSHSIGNAHKRKSSELVLDSESESCKRGHCNATEEHSHVKYETMRFSERGFEDGAGFDHSNIANVSLGDNPIEFQASLRKCSIASMEGIHLTQYDTPGPPASSFEAHDTPKPKRGSSTISPGETFWNEAILVAEKAEVVRNHSETKNLGSLNSGGPGECLMKSNATLNEANMRSCEYGNNIVASSQNFKDLDRENSPLPVRHFDFSFEDKILSKIISDTSSKEPMQKIDEYVGCSSTSHKTLPFSSVKVSCSKAPENQLPHQIREVASNSVGKADIVTPEIAKISSTALAEQIDTSAARCNYNDESPSSSSLPLNDRLDLSNWLPSEICSIYRKRGISKLYPWQVDCLQVDGVLQKRNLVYCASTSAGKSFVAEILMLRRVLNTGKIALLVLPYVSICAEKAEHLEAILEPLNKHVRSYYGNQGGGTLPKDTSVAVCTIEKANSLINKLLEEGRLSEVGIIVIDELHMVGDQSRGYLLELMLTKLRYASGEGSSESLTGDNSGSSSGRIDPTYGLQIVGMSATLPNVAAVADWLQAALYQTDFRPIPLEEYIKVGDTIYDKDMAIVRTLAKGADLGGKDPDHVVELCNEVVQEGHSVLLFCSSRKGCESTAIHVSKSLKKFSTSVHGDQNDVFNITSAIDELRKSPAGLDPILEETLPSGVAYHHAGLTVEERGIVETCYRRGLVRVLTATSTLAAGVNLPARRVIFRQPRIGCDFIDGTRYRQMAGRAGRTGIDTRGESILICKLEEVKRIKGLLNDSCPPLQSCLSEDKNGMIHAILEVVAGGIVQTANDVHRYVRCTLLNSTKPFEDVVMSAQDSLKWLCHKKFLEWNEDTKLYSSTPLGRAAFGSSLCPEESITVLDDLLRAREGFVLASDLHLVYLITPINVDVEPDWELYYERFMQLGAVDQSVGNRVGVQEPFLMRMAHGAPMRTSSRSRNITKGLQNKFDQRRTNHDTLTEYQNLRVCKRFYIALILSRLVQETPVSEVCEAFRVARGMVQSLQENAGRFASMVSVFCERLGWHDLEGLVSKFQNRVSFGVRAEIVELTMIPYVKGSRARALFKVGLRTPQAIAEAKILDISKAIFDNSWAMQGSAQLRMQLGVAKKIKNGARRIVLDKAEEARLVAFSAFKSLGLNIPQLPMPMLSIVTDYTPQKEVADFVDPETNNSENSEHMEDATDELSMKNVENLNKLTSKFEKKSTKTSIPCPGTESTTFDDMDSKLDSEKTLALVQSSNEISATVDHIENGYNASSLRLVRSHSKNRIGNHLDQLGDEKQRNARTGEGPICAVSVPGGFDSFLNCWDGVLEFCFDVHFSKRFGVNSISAFEVLGIAICWDNSPVYYVNLPKDLLWHGKKRGDDLFLNAGGQNMNVISPEHPIEMAKRRWNKICRIMGKDDVKKFAWNLKIQIQVLKCPVISTERFGIANLSVRSMGLELCDNSSCMLSPIYVKNTTDLCIVAWILWPDEERSSNPNLAKEVKKKLSTEAAAAANRDGRWKNQMRRAAHNGCCLRVAQTRALLPVLWKLLVSEGLVEALLSVEIPLVNVLADMELCGIGVDMDGCLKARHVLGRKLRYLEKEAYKLAGMTFSLHNAADIANVLYGHLKLPIPEGYRKWKQHPSTDKHCLDLLSAEHPIVSIIKEHRTLAKLLNCTLGSICSLARLSPMTQKYTIHGHWLQTSTATGRLSMEEPNLQCVEHMVEFKLNDTEKEVNVSNAEHHKISPRCLFVPTQDNWLLLTADYSQIELRLMAHFSKDSSLIELLSAPQGDIFTMIAAKWTGKVESSINSQEREQTKKLVYGILYGMGGNTLAEQLNCSSDDAAEKIQNFKSTFPSVTSWLREAVTFCRQKGYVETLKGRKRFLEKIKFGDNKEKLKAQRQAVNSICQGSAADIIKLAMASIHSVVMEDVWSSWSSSVLVEKFQMLRGRCHILLQVHDELILEVDPAILKEAALLLRTCMESAASLLVPLHVKLKVGKTWGSLEPFLDEKDTVK